MKLWVDDVVPAPAGYHWARSVNEAKRLILDAEELASKPRMFDCDFKYSLIDVDHNAGDMVSEGGHYIELLKWLEETGRSYPVHIHSDNQINRVWMLEIITRNGWKEIR